MLIFAARYGRIHVTERCVALYDKRRTADDTGTEIESCREVEYSSHLRPAFFVIDAVL